MSTCLFLSDQNADDCVASPQLCDANAVCENIAESNICICKPGFAGNGKICAGSLKQFVAYDDLTNVSIMKGHYGEFSFLSSLQSV